MDNVEFTSIYELKVGDTVYYGYFYAPEDFIPDKHIKSGIIVELDDENYKVVIANVENKRFITIPHYCYNKAENEKYIDYQDYDDDKYESAYMCYGKDKSKVSFQLSFKALSMIKGEYDKVKKRMQELETSINKLEKEIGAELK